MIETLICALNFTPYIMKVAVKAARPQFRYCLLCKGLGDVYTMTWSTGMLRMQIISVSVYQMWEIILPTCKRKYPGRHIGKS